MTVKELKEKLNGVDENLQVGWSSCGVDVGEYEYAEVLEVFADASGSFERLQIFCISIEYAGEEPD